MNPVAFLTFLRNYIGISSLIPFLVVIFILCLLGKPRSSRFYAHPLRYKLMDAGLTKYVLIHSGFDGFYLHPIYFGCV